jgi:phage portal protein BeeE
MPKPKLSDFKKLLAEMNEEELRGELLKLFQKLEQVQTFYAQDLLSKEDRQKILDEAKKKINRQFWTPSGNPKMNTSNAEIRKNHQRI